MDTTYIHYKSGDTVAIPKGAKLEQLGAIQGSCFYACSNEIHGLAQLGLRSTVSEKMKVME